MLGQCLVQRLARGCSTSRVLSMREVSSIRDSQPVALSSTVYGDPSVNKGCPPLIVCHGLFGQKMNWNSVAKVFQKQLNNVVYAVDLRNHGESPWSDSMTYADMAADLLAFLKKVRDETGFQKSVLLGHSMGGKAVMRLAVDPEGAPFIEKLIVEDVSPKGYSVSSHHFRFYVEAMKKADLTKTRAEIGKQLEHDVPDFGIRQFLLTNLRVVEAEDGTKSFEWKVNLNAIANSFEAVLGMDTPVGAYRGKTLFVYGEKSGYVPKEDRPLIKNLFPQVEFDEIKGASHWVHADNPKAFILSVCDFVKQK